MNSMDFIGVDIGTESVRAGLFTDSGELLATARRQIRTWHARDGFVEQSTVQIWEGIVEAIRELLLLDGRKMDDGSRQIGGIGFCATCSMAVVDGHGKPLKVGIMAEEQQQTTKKVEQEPVRNVIVWMDHRATEQAERINASGHPILRFTGGRISPEMQTPKLLWLKENVPETFARAAHFFDLADFFTWRATGSTQRSICTLTCKWTFLGHEQRWDESFFRDIGLAEIVKEGFRRVGQQIRPVGAPIGDGLAAEAAREFGLPEGIPVGAALIDAHAGALGTIGGDDDGDNCRKRKQQMALILGTSLCTMNITREPATVNGVWGPYFGVVRPELWLNEGGMSAFGSALLFALRLHPFYQQMRRQFKNDDSQLLSRLELVAISHAGSLEACSIAYGKMVHIVPEFLGNRSPDADPLASGVLCGLRMDDPMWAENELAMAEWTVLVLCGLCYGIKDIIDQIEQQTAGGTHFGELVVSGGMTRSSLLLRLVADITQIDVFVPHCTEPVLLGAALTGAVASGHFTTIVEASRQMIDARRQLGLVIVPQMNPEVKTFHKHKFEVYKALKQCERTIRALRADQKI